MCLAAGNLGTHATTVWLPFMVEVLPPVTSLRKVLNIPEDAYVFGRHGGWNQFDVDFVQRAVADFQKPNTREFMPASPNVIFLPADPSLQGRSDFIACCDAMVHGRSDGETFGLACGEFSVANKPVLTTNRGDLAHIHILQPNVFVAGSKEQYTENMEVVMNISGPRSFDAYTQFDRAATAKTFKELVSDALVP